MSSYVTVYLDQKEKENYIFNDNLDIHILLNSLFGIQKVYYDEMNPYLSMIFGKPNKYILKSIWKLREILDKII